MGFDFYAPQTFEDPNGRRILIGWMGMPDADEEYTNPTADEENWQHCLTVPREVTVKNGQLYQWPIKEFEGLRREARELTCENSEVRVEGPVDVEVQVESNRSEVHLGEDLWLEYADGKVSLHLAEAAGAGRKVRNAFVPSGKVTDI